MDPESLSPGKQDKFQPLRNAYRAALPQRISEICVRWASVQRGYDTTVEQREFQRLVHTFAGSAGTFGFHALGDMARELEDFLNESDDGPKDQRHAEIERRLAMLRSLAQAQEVSRSMSAKEEKW